MEVKRVVCACKGEGKGKIWLVNAGKGRGEEGVNCSFHRGLLTCRAIKCALAHTRNVLDARVAANKGYIEETYFFTEFIW